MDGIILNPNACCLVDDIITAQSSTGMGVIGNQSKQEMANMINHFSDLIQGDMYLNRLILKKKYTEDYDGVDHPTSITVKAPPITIDDELEVWDDPTREFTDSDSYRLSRNEDYYVQSAGPHIGAVRIRIAACSAPFNQDYGNIRVIYNGGIVYNDENNVTVPSWLRGLAIAQVTAWWQKSKNPGLISQTIAPNVHSEYDKWTLLPEVKNALASFRLKTYGC